MLKINKENPLQQQKKVATSIKKIQQNKNFQNIIHQ
jgi:hypothetical protein